jgi:hypothetical protein
MGLQGHVARTGEETTAYRLLVGKPERKRSLGSPTCRSVDNIKIDIVELGWIGEWTGLVWLRIGTNGELL